MSEANILNPTAASMLNPKFGYTEQRQPQIATFKPQKGRSIARQLAADGRVIDLSWDPIDSTTKFQLMQWEAQYRLGFFSLQDFDAARYYSGRFAGPLKYSPTGNNKWQAQGQFVEECGAPLYAYPTNWARDAIFLEERDEQGLDQVKLTGAWAYVSGGYHNGNAYASNTPNDTAEWVYVGYGFRVWSNKAPNFGNVEISVDGTVLGTVDLYDAGGLNSFAVFTKADLPFDYHRVKLRVLNTHNGASSDYYVAADALEVMQ